LEGYGWYGLEGYGLRVREMTGHPLFTIRRFQWKWTTFLILSWLNFGFPKTKEGYYGVLVIMERLTRFPFVYPIKSKESIEIAEKLFDYISLAGPSKSLQSNCGTEFLNKIIDALLKSTGIDRKTSSSYNPRVQGLCENFNSVLAEALRKCGEKDKDNWHKFIPFVLMAYRSRVHSSHGYSPYELMFGKKMNHFDNWKVVPTKLHNYIRER
jgi:transposase InsO family protein